MTDLTREQIEEIKKRKSLFDRGEVVNFLSVGEAHDLARQLLATMDTLADQTGVKLLAEMRSERDELRRENGILRGNAKAQGLVDEIGATGKNRRKTEGKLARTIEGQRAALRKLQGVVERHKTRAEAAEAQLAEVQKREEGLREAGERALRALKPFADRVFNDNDDCTISDTHLLTGADFMNAYQAHGKLRTALSATPTGEESHG